jgi:hypothetical protein
MFAGKPVVNFHVRWNSREESGVEWLEQDIITGQASKPGGVIIIIGECHKEREVDNLTICWNLFLDARR